MRSSLREDCVSPPSGVSFGIYNICGFVLMLKADEEAEESRIKIEFLTIDIVKIEFLEGNK